MYNQDKHSCEVHVRCREGILHCYWLLLDLINVMNLWDILGCSIGSFFSVVNIHWAL